MLLLVTTIKCNETKLFSVSNALKQALEQNGIRNITVVYNGINLDNYIIDEDKTSTWKKENNLENNTIILTGGRLSTAKGTDYLIEAFKLVSQKK